MKTAARFLRLLALTLWVGGIAFFAFVVAPVAFHILPSQHQAGLIVGASLGWLHQIGLGCGIAYLIGWLLDDIAGPRERPYTTARIGLVVAIAVMMAVTAISQFGIIPRMEKDRLEAGGDINAVAKDAPPRVDFERIHPLSEKLEGFVLLLGFLAVGLESRES